MAGKKSKSKNRTRAKDRNYKVNKNEPTKMKRDKHGRFKCGCSRTGMNRSLENYLTPDEKRRAEEYAKKAASAALQNIKKVSRRSPQGLLINLGVDRVFNNGRRVANFLSR